MPSARAHPTREELTAFGQGKLPDRVAASMADHLASCPACREMVAASPPDSFIGKLRKVTPGPSTSVTFVPSASGQQVPNALAFTPLADLPAELASHPKYRIVRELGRGGMGVVYQAVQILMERHVALKVINPAVLNHPEALPRFHAEVKAAARLDHPNIVRAHDAEKVGQLHLLVMEYVEGTTLADGVRHRGVLPVKVACHYLRQAALGLQHAFEQGMAHRDIKPGNLMVTDAGIVKILDFGLARLRTEGKSGGLTQMDAFIGTPEYVSPEQATDARTADIRSDIYSLGCTFYYMLAGRPPFEEDTAVKQVLAQIEQEPPSLESLRSDVPPGLSAVAARMLAKDPAQRYQTPIELARALVAFIKPGEKEPAVAVPTPAPATHSPARETAFGRDTSRMPAIRSAPRPTGFPEKRTSKASPAADTQAQNSKKKGPKERERAYAADKPLPAGSVGRKPPTLWLLVMAGGLAASLLAGILFLWPTPRGLVKIETDDPTIEIAFDKTGPTIKGAGKEPISLAIGQHGVHIKRGDFEFDTETFFLKTGETTSLRVELVKGEICVSADGHVIAAQKLPVAVADGVATANPLPGALTNSIGTEFVLVPKGRSWLGGRSGRPGDKEVVFGRDFYLGKYPVTREEWAKVMDETSTASLTPQSKRMPATNVSWNDAQAFLERLNKREKGAGWTYRLPKEAEWEYACRGGPMADPSESAYDYYFDKPSNQPLLGQANFSLTGHMQVCKVGLYKPNRLGLYDMHGNIHEWCDDESGAAGRSVRVVRGGCCRNDTSVCPAALAFADPPERRTPALGLRLARVPTDVEVVQVLPGANKVAQVPAPPAVAMPPDVAAIAPKISGRPFFVRGDWTIENDELIQPTLATGDEFCPLLVLGEATLSNYDVTVEAKQTGGRGSVGTYFHWLGPGHCRYFHLGGNGGIDFCYRYNGKWGREDGNWKWLRYLSNRWYSLKLEVRGGTFRAYMDDVLQFEQTDARFTDGRFCLFTSNATARFRRIKITDPQGRVLFEGLPELPRSSDKATAKADIGSRRGVLTSAEKAAATTQQQWARRLKTPVISTNSLGAKLALIPPGEFQMGSPESEKQRGGLEQQHLVRITKPFYLGVYEVTQSEFEQVMGRNPSSFSNGGGPAEAATGVDTSRYPVETVSWCDAVEFCNRLSEKEGRRPYYRIASIEREANGGIKEATVSVEGGGGYRLPTEAQWEYACRAGTATPFSFGTANNGTECSCNGKVPYGTDEPGPALGRTVRVGSYRPNAFGLYDMHGNVREWCWDVFDQAYYLNSPASDPTGPPAGTLRVIRGANWSNEAAACRSARRNRDLPGHRWNGLGFRVARSSGE